MTVINKTEYAVSPQQQIPHLVRINNPNLTACGKTITPQWTVKAALWITNDWIYIGCRRCKKWGHRLSKNALARV